MSCDCCSAPAVAADPALCPNSGNRGQSVEWRTVAALTRTVVPPRQSFWLCRDAECDVVYFGEAGTCLGSSDLRVEPGFKAACGDGLVCYCFLYRHSDIEAELRSPSESTILDRIKEKVQARSCACDVRNPAGNCCLGEIKKLTERLQKSLATDSFP